MKKIAFTAAALFVLAGSTVSAFSSQTNTQKSVNTTIKAVAIPPAGCPMGDPNGCGIFD